MKPTTVRVTARRKAAMRSRMKRNRYKIRFSDEFGFVDGHIIGKEGHCICCKYLEAARQ